MEAQVDAYLDFYKVRVSMRNELGIVSDFVIVPCLDNRKAVHSALPLEKSQPQHHRGISSTHEPPHATVESRTCTQQLAYARVGKTYTARADAGR